MAEAKAQISFVPHEGMAASIDAMLQRGTPGYYSLCQAMSEAAKPFLRPNARVIDLNARGGDWIEPLLEQSSFRCRFIALNSTDADKERCMDRFRMDIRMGAVQELKRDLCEGIPPITGDLTICALAMTTKPSECQERVLKGIYKHTQKGGGVILVEELSGTNWENELRQAGFKDVVRIWSSSRVGAWVAVR